MHLEHDVLRPRRAGEERRGAERFLRMMVNTGERDKVARLIER